MSQLDILHYTPTLFWVTILFFVFFFIVNKFYFFTFYINLRVRFLFKLFLKKLYSSVYKLRYKFLNYNKVGKETNAYNKYLIKFKFYFVK